MNDDYNWCTECLYMFAKMHSDVDTYDCDLCNKTMCSHNTYIFYLPFNSADGGGLVLCKTCAEAETLFPVHRPANY